MNDQFFPLIGGPLDGNFARESDTERIVLAVDNGRKYAQYKMVDNKYVYEETVLAADLVITRKAKTND